MKIRKLLILTVALSLLGGTAIFADTVTQKVKVIFNKQEIDDAGALVDGKAFLGVRSLGDTIQAITVWDDSAKKVTIFKPNVHIFLMTGSKPFGEVQNGKSTSFKVFAQIDNLLTDISAFKVTISDPYGEETWIDGRTSKDDDFPKSKDNFWFTSDNFTYKFNSAGRYTLRFWMKPSDTQPMQIVSEKTIISK
ncbi:copper amine oxidase N-terminal domain-containing protein [Cohnella sp. REN36]|uniref:copper amine oxidase N-terminal domain-containing protein n=1 Tax=Cohnella sp. REN36 TaxID=2887347 RepID=UPI001D15438B|nr:copper amine oxidase N-terminal domain-containing protein [Cohnella sp. REN36]MCC3372936.1 copper amine oxidase N-terminal domain-containing protein [Cohnella sp. REN36]